MKREKGEGKRHMEDITRKIGDFWGQKQVKKAEKGQKNGQKSAL